MDLAITGVGAVTSVGRTVTATCAAIRCGIAAPGALDHYHVLEEQRQELVAVDGHPARAYTEGFVGLGRLLRLSLGATQDWMADETIPPPGDKQFWQRTSLVCVAPRLDERRWSELEHNDSAGIRSGHLAALVRALGVPIAPPAVNHFVAAGAAGLCRAFLFSDQALGRSADRVVIVAADSYVDGESLDWLNAAGRLKAPGHPVGLMPGEAGACVVVERRATAKDRGSHVKGVVEAASFEIEPHHLEIGSPSLNTGAALTRVVRAALAGVRNDPFDGDVISDCNGEPWRASEWGCAQSRLIPVLGSGYRTVCPAMSVGDVGAASSTLGALIAVQSFARGYARGARTLVVSSSEYGDVGAFVMRAER